MSNFLNNTTDLEKIYNEVDGIGDLIIQISNALTGKAGPESDIVVSSIATTTASPSITIPDAVGKANIALMYMSSGGYQESAMADAGLGSVIVHGESHSYTIMYTSKLTVGSDDGFIEYDSATGTISMASNMRYNETFIAGNYMYVTWGSIDDDNASSESNLITFYILREVTNEDGSEGESTTHTYQAENGMTWSEWVESEYNSDGYCIITSVNNQIADQDGEFIYAYNSNMDSLGQVTSTELIDPSNNYRIYVMPM